MPPLPSSTTARLNRHLAQRLAQQVREVLALWQQLAGAAPTPAQLAALVRASQRLERSAERLEHVEYLLLAMALVQTLRSPGQHGAGELIDKLSRSALRHGDVLSNTPLPPSPAPLCLLLHSTAQAEQLARQLDSFGVAARVFETAAQAIEAMASRQPLALVVDIDLNGILQGLQAGRQLHAQWPAHVPLLYYCDHEADTATRLAAVRSHGDGFLCAPLEAPALLETLEPLTHVTRYSPYRVLVVDDSAAQASHTQRMLTNAGMQACALSDPLHALAAIADFRPDLLLLDLYMPACSGPELARVVRQNERWLSLPIIYLSAEQNLDKQLDALSEAGDDFLVKPVRSRQLISAVRNRAERGRQLSARMTRDSLTGLFNHTYILQQLDDSLGRAQHAGMPLCFAMLDIDHFKKVNDTYGHPMGDRVIKSLALFLGQRLRRTDFIGRYGGEEFAIVMPGTALEAATQVLDDIRQGFASLLYPAMPSALQCTFSAGVVQFSEGADAALLAALADQALYRAKAQGRNCVVAAG